MTLMSASVSTFFPTLVSSANFFMVSTPPTTVSISLMKMRNSRGPSTLPCGTPDKTSIQDENDPFSTTRCTLSPSQSPIHFSTFPSTPWALSFFRSLFTGTLSNALAKSRNATSNGVPSSTAAVAFSMNSSKFVTQDRPFMNPCWLRLIKPFLSRCSTMASFITDSITLQLTEVSETGL